MLVLFGILIIVASVILGFIVLIQNPKGGGVSGVLGGVSNQLIGVKSSTDVMEKGTWIFAAIVGILCVISPAFIPKDGTASSKNDDLLKGTTTKPQQTVPTPNTTTTMPPVVQDTTKKP
ncbi:MAG: preprotein translocase subunit SecG [Ferruginibacter sp.]|nr:preprotein translocase subunit SecG [Ferruginibacter sp.]